jgi:hypothetical chaperone protein
MFCAIDFGTSNSAIAAPTAEGPLSLVALEAGEPTMPTAVFYRAERRDDEGGVGREFGRAAIAAYVDGIEGRLMRSMKSLLGSTLIDQTTEVGGGRAVSYLSVLSGYLQHLKHTAENERGVRLEQAVIGRPVFFVDDDARRDAAAQAALGAAAQQAGFQDVRFQYEPIAAAFDHEQGLAVEQCVLVADIGGGTSDFAVVRVGPDRADRPDRRDDILAHHGVHIAGTDFDRRIALEAIMPAFGYRARGPASGGRGGDSAREVPSGIYFDLATWHLINTAYHPARLAELRAMRSFYSEPRHHARLMTVLAQRLGHGLAAGAERAKIAVASGASGRIDLSSVERGLDAEVSLAQALDWIDTQLESIAGAARLTVQAAGLAPADIDALYFTGGSTGLSPLTQRIATAFPNAVQARGDAFASVANGLALHAARVFAPRRRNVAA